MLCTAYNDTLKAMRCLDLCPKWEKCQNAHQETKAIHKKGLFTFSLWHNMGINKHKQRKKLCASFFKTHFSNTWHQLWINPHRTSSKNMIISHVWQSWTDLRPLHNSLDNMPGTRLLVSSLGMRTIERELISLKWDAKTPTLSFLKYFIASMNMESFTQQLSLLQFLCQVFSSAFKSKTLRKWQPGAYRYATMELWLLHARGAVLVFVSLSLSKRDA